MKSTEQRDNEHAILVLLVIFGFACPVLWIAAFFAWLGGYGRY